MGRRECSFFYSFSFTKAQKLNLAGMGQSLSIDLYAEIFSRFLPCRFFGYATLYFTPRFWLHQNQPNG